MEILFLFLFFGGTQEVLDHLSTFHHFTTRNQPPTTTFNSGTFPLSSGSLRSFWTMTTLFEYLKLIGMQVVMWSSLQLNVTRVVSLNFVSCSCKKKQIMKSPHRFELLKCVSLEKSSIIVFLILMYCTYQSLLFFYSNDNSFVIMK